MAHDMAWKSVIEGIIAGTATAITWVALLFLTNLMRNMLLDKQLRKGFSNIGYSFGENSFGIILRNETNIPVKVWGVSFSFKNGGYAPLSFTGEKTASRKIRLRRFSKPRWSYIDFPSFFSGEENGAVRLEFNMAGTWAMEKEEILPMTSPDGAYCLLEYSTLIGTKKRIVVEAKKVDELQDAVQRYCGRWRDNISSPVLG